MKRMPLLMTLLALIALVVSAAYWAMQLYKPAQRPLAAAPAASMPDPAIDAAASLFGGQPAASASNYQLVGVVAAGRDSAAILVVDNGAPMALKVGKEVVNGLRVQQVFPRYVLLSDGRRIDIAQESRVGTPAGQPGQAQPVQPPPQPMPQPQPQPVQQPPQAAPIQLPQPSMTGAPMPNTPPPNAIPTAPPVRGAPTINPPASQ
ncbi:type II secretion system protein N [Massilia sp. DWR3-1-1]|uniref:type II secretion system protein N n=1 Tax=Massilia sp. DWR3-1-1 TaxID=2804559 RepID=UPI003CF106A9